ncbi:DegT/DnrJ/EryC1/StrS family aminotransferase [Leisingera sp. NJS204]|uniref:DegT/DnrJ/EryC1/StrS family aminotransferase n=1 Tax=Leisingera sp. NJS204 TaxID=2508307 RepID=UPI0010119ECB|nr:DegT/DnrJ/EryC1/StrS family aminotransferase [Leisingera sp. NJS204]QAX30636.1 DegT/DnrJ/EryC1/StrS family aminotransferase [Leisingera sp. NJS204]
MKVSFLDIAGAHAEIQDQLEAAVLRVTRSGHFILGPEVEAFEADFARYTGAPRCLGTGNGLDALILALKAMGIGPGDEVIVPANTYIATWLAVSFCGATIVPVEPLEATHNIGPEAVAAAITSRTKAIIPVHLYGQPADMDPLIELAGQHGLHLLEDAAQAHGAKYKGKRIGSFGEAACWSFYPGKNLGALGDGGGFTTTSPELAERVSMLRNYGSAVKYEHELAGQNSRLDPMQAAALQVKLQVLDDWNTRRQAIAARYLEALSAAGLVLPAVPEWADPVWHLFVVRHPDRDAFRTRLEAAGVGTVIHYPKPPHLQNAYAGLGYGKGAFPVSETLAAQVISLPIGPAQTEAQTEYVVEQVLKLA